MVSSGMPVMKRHADGCTMQGRRHAILRKPCGCTRDAVRTCPVPLSALARCSGSSAEHVGSNSGTCLMRY